MYFFVYSLPLADTVLNFIFSFINKNSKIYIINPDVTEIKKRMAKISGSGYPSDNNNSIRRRTITKKL